MDESEVKETVVFGFLLILGFIIIWLFFTVGIEILGLFILVFKIALSKCFRGTNEEALLEEIIITSNNSSNNNRRLNLLEIISHVFWFRVIYDASHCFFSAILPLQFQPTGFTDYDGWPVEVKLTPFVFKYMLNNPSETAADFAECFTRRVLSNLGFHLYSSSSSSDNIYKNYQGCHDPRVSRFEQALSKSCFARELVERYNSIDWDNNGGVPPTPPTQFSGLERKAFWFYFLFKDDEWVEPFNNWFNWYIKVIHGRIFTSVDYLRFEATVKYLFFCFLHDLANPFISWFALFGITTL